MRRRYVFFGRVQGVGFRATARDAALLFPLAGWVRNDPEGTVTLEVQGDEAEIDRFIDDLHRRMGRHISRSTVTQLDTIHDEQGFRIDRHPLG